MPNRLAGQASLYLRQHAHNPVDWFPWGEEAFAEARRRAVPIFLSIGYSTCYWCHVMERESFEDPAVARQLAEGFVSIKVDREERPDVDEIYMAATVIATGQGGWPMSVFLDPTSLRPFLCGTYFPPLDGHGRPSFSAVLRAVARAWAERRDAVLAQARELALAVEEQTVRAGPVTALGREQVGAAVASLLRMVDRVNGGFGVAPKFPQPVFLELLLDARSRTDAQTTVAIDAALRVTLDAMAAGGIHDHLAGGFHRYSVDASWTVPHFEKMLYDNAQLAGVYARAGDALREPEYRRVAQRTIAFVLREMHDGATGAFHSAIDAEVDGREGLNYVWTPGEFRGLLGPDAPFAMRCFGLDAGPNFHDPHHPDAPPANVLRLSDRLDRCAARLGMPEREFEETYERVRERLLEARRARRGPRTDTKSVASWSGMMVRAIAHAARLWGDAPTLLAAERAAAFLIESHRPANALKRIVAEGAAYTAAFLEDYANVIAALAELHRTGSRARPWLDSAALLHREAVALFTADGAVFDTRADQPDLFLRARSTHDGAIPSAASVFVLSSLDLADLTGDAGYRRRALDALLSYSDRVAASPLACANSVRALLALLAGPDASALAPPGAAAAPAREATPDEAPAPVEIHAPVDRLTLRSDRPEELTLLVRIAPEYHVAAADPGAPGLHPFRVGVIGGAGVAAYADYPEGEAHGPEGQRSRVYRGEFELRVALERSGEWKGRPLLAVTYQACTDAHCLAPATVELDIAIDRA